MDATVRKGKKDEKMFRFTVKQLPSKIVYKPELERKVEKDKIKLTLKKQDPNNCWRDKLRSRGIDQASSSEDDD